MELEWVPARPKELPPRVVAQTARAWDRAIAAYRRRHGRGARRAVVFWDGIEKVDRVEVT